MTAPAPMLTDEQIARWQTTGRLQLAQALAPSTVANLDRWVSEVERWATDGGPGLHHREQTDRGPALARSEDFDPHHEGLSRFMRTGVIADVLHQLFGEPAALFKEKINYKQPGGAGFAPHQDASAYRFVDHHISCMVPLDPATIDSGCLYFGPMVETGTDHDRPILLPNEAGRIDPGWVAAADWQAAPCQPGDLVFFDSYVPHYSGTNETDRSRRVMYVTYNRRSQGDHRAIYYADKRDHLAGSEPGATVRISINDDFLGRPVEPN